MWAAVDNPEAIKSMTLIGAFVRDPKTTLFERLLLPVIQTSADSHRHVELGQAQLALGSVLRGSVPAGCACVQG